MKLLGLARFLIALSVATPAATDRSGKVSYDGYKVYKISNATNMKAELEALAAIELNHDHGASNGATLNIAIPSHKLAAFEGLNLAADIISENLGVDIAAEKPLGVYPDLDETRRGLPSLSWYDSYHAYEDHVRYWADLQAAFAENSELIEAGVSFEGRPIQGIHLWGSGGKDSRPAIFFNGNVHAREWITSKVVEYLLYQIIIGYENDTTVQTILDNYDFYVLPVVNPDGFVHTQTTNRLWRKNRQTRENTTGIGTDINRNWPVGFGGGGSSMDPDSETFSGYEAGDSPECAALIDFAQGLAGNNGIKLYVDWHSYAQTILLSYGYTCEKFPANYEDQLSLAAGTAAAIAGPYNTTFEYGSGCVVLYQSSGNGRDYMTDAAGTEYGWGIELRDTDYGFMLPADQILESGEEIWEGMKYLWANM